MMDRRIAMLPLLALAGTSLSGCVAAAIPAIAGITCIVDIAGDERADFDERFKYLRNPEAGAGLEPVIGDGWFLITSLFAEAVSAGQ